MLNAESCADAARTGAEAIRTLISEPSCLDAAVERLEIMVATHGQPRDVNDLSAAYYLRAQRTDRPSDLLRALELAQQAVAQNPQLREARFNVALAQEALGLSEDAIKSWQEVRRSDRTEWAAEAAYRAQKLSEQKAANASTQWILNRERLNQAVRVGDRAAVAQLIEPFPGTVQRYVEDEVLPDWAEALSQNRREVAEQHLALAEMVAEELARLTGDRFLLDAVQAINDSRSSRSVPKAHFEVLRTAHLIFGQARRAEKESRFQPAVIGYREAAQSFGRAGSPLRLSADLGIAVTSVLSATGNEQATSRLSFLEQEVREHRYDNLWARVQSTRAWILVLQSRYVDALALYDAAGSSFARMRDLASLSDVHLRKMEIFRILGSNDLAWREALQALRNIPHFSDAQHSHLVLGETAKLALASGYPRIALQYQDAAVRMSQMQLINTPSDIGAINRRQGNLALALIARAAIHLHLEHYESAQRDIDEAIRFTGAYRNAADGDFRRGIAARVKEVVGQASLNAAPRRAIVAFTEALSLTTSDQYRTFRASLLVQRAAAYRKAGESDAAERDLRTVIDQLRVEQMQLLQGNRRGETSLWATYFSRLRETYDLLIGQLADEGRTDEAFAYAEKGRALDLLNRVSERDVAPKAFRKLAETNQPLEREQVQTNLPLGTSLIEFYVLQDKTLIWLVSNDRFEFFTQRVGRREIATWTNRLQAAASQRNQQEFEAGLSTPFSQLLAKPLAAIERSSAGRTTGTKLVFVPDGPMHGLPFGALRNPASGRHVIEDFAIATCSSATLYVFALLRDAMFSSLSPSPSRLLLVGDPAFSRGEFTEGRWRSRGSQLELKYISELYAGDVSVLTGGAATITHFLYLARDRTIVHLAVPAIVNLQAPDRSLLLMAPSTSDSGFFYADDLASRLRLERTRLVVLSGCTSAGGLPVGSGGLGALVSPFFAAGVPAVVGSLWESDETKTTELLVRFHRYYRDGFDATSALRNAQLDLLYQRNPGQGSVLTWAPFQVIGHSSSPFHKPLH